ncbi:MAG: hypothetical protein ACQEWS_08305 [Bacillota bacterium]
MSNIEQNFLDIYRLISSNEKNNRFLFYKESPLSSDHPDVTNDDQIPLLIYRSPKTNDLEDEKPIARMCMYLANGTPTNNLQIQFQDIMIDIYTSIDEVEQIELRNLKIQDNLAQLLFESRVTGFGKIVNYKRLLIPNSPNGYIGYKLIFTFGTSK